MVVAAQTKVEGVIKGRDGSKIILQTADSPKLIVLLTDTTDVAQVQGVLKARKKQMSMAALVPGLPIKVEGTYDAQNQLVAETVRFKGNDLEQAQAIQASFYETQAQSQQNKEELEKQNAALKTQNEALTEQQKLIEANKAAIAANTARFGQLDDYYIWDEVTRFVWQRQDQGRSPVRPSVGSIGGKSQDRQRLCNSGERLRLGLRQLLAKPEDSAKIAPTTSQTSCCSKVIFR